MISINSKEGKENARNAGEVIEGIAKCKIVAINPTKAELKEVLSINTENEPKYVYTKEEPGRLVPGYPEGICPMIRIVIWYEITEPMALKGRKITQTIFVENKPKKDRDGNILVIDEYGRFAKVTKEELSSREIPKTKNGVNATSKNYRPAVIGEIELTSLIKDWLKIPYYQEDKRNEAECQARLEIDMNFWKGNVTEIKTLVPICKDKEVQVLMTGEKAEDGIRQGIAGVYRDTTHKDSIMQKARRYWPNKYLPMRLETFDEAHIIQGRETEEKREGAEIKESSHDNQTLPF